MINELHTEHEGTAGRQSYRKNSESLILGDNGPGIEDAKVSRLYFNRYQQFELCSAFINLIQIASMVIVYDLIFEEIFLEIQIVILYTLVIFSGLLAFITLLRYKSLLDWHIVRGSLSSKEDLISSGFIYFYLFEVLIMLAIPTPWYNDIRIYFFNDYLQAESYYMLNSIMCLSMVFRLLFIIRFILVQTSWFCNRAQRVCNLYACEANYLFVIKSLMRTRPYEAIFSTMVLLVLVFGYAIRICESPLTKVTTQTNDFISYPNSFWNIIVTMTTLGYGDFFARTLLGRTFIFIICITGIFIVSMMVVTLTNSTQPTLLEGKAMTVYQRVILRKQMIEEAGTVITIMAKIGLGMRRGTLTVQNHQYLLLKMRDYQKRFRLTNRQYRNLRDSGSLAEEMSREFNNLREDLKEIAQKQKELHEGADELLNMLNLGKQKIINQNENADEIIIK